MESKKTLVAVVSAVIIALSAVLLLRRCGSEETTREPRAQWVCDHCGYETKAAQGSGSADCPRCEQGQMVRRVSYQCEGCGEVVEGYQLNYAPAAPRAENARKEAEAQEKLGEGMPPEATELVRKPDGKWAWRSTRAGQKIIDGVLCPRCGGASRGKLKKVLDTPAQ